MVASLPCVVDTRADELEVASTILNQSPIYLLIDYVNGVDALFLQILNHHP